jgi:hypothetical protein
MILNSCQTNNTWECDGNCDNGEGLKKWEDGGIEKGAWKNGELEGNGFQLFGKTSDFAGDSYEGNFVIGKYDGFGTYIDVSEDAKYIGGWKDGKFHGKGKLTFGAKSKYPNRYYDGDWINGKQHGNGIMFWGKAGKHTNNKYQGEWQNDNMNGFGRYDWPDGGYYIGEWRDDEQNGKGVYTFPDGKKLESQWKDGYCRELAVILYGENASSFTALIDDINKPTFDASQEFIDAMTIVFRELERNKSYEIDFRKHFKLLDSAIINVERVLPQLERMQEFDKEVKYKTDYLNTIYALYDALREFDNWLELMQSKSDNEKVSQSKEQIFEKLKIMKVSQIKFVKTKEDFNKKYWK